MMHARDISTLRSTSDSRRFALRDAICLRSVVIGLRCPTSTDATAHMPAQTTSASWAPKADTVLPAVGSRRLPFSAWYCDSVLTAQSLALSVSPAIMLVRGNRADALVIGQFSSRILTLPCLRMPIGIADPCEALRTGGR